MRVAIGALLLGLMLLAEASLAQAPRGQTSDTKSSKSSSDSPSSVGGKSLEEWKKELSSEDASRRAQAILAIMQFGDDAATCVPALIERLSDRDVSPRARALLALRTIAVDEKDVDRVVRAVAYRLLPTYESQAVIRYEATITLRRFIEDGQPAIPALITASLDRSSWEIRNNAVSLMWRIGVATNKDNNPDQRVIEALLQSLRFEKTYQVKMETIQGLGAMGRPANNPALLAKIVSELHLCSVHRNKPLAIWAYCGLVAMQDGTPALASLNTLSKFLMNDHLETRIQAAIALGALKDKAKSKVPLLLAMLKDKEPYAVHAACSALGAIGDKTDTVVDPMIELVSHKDPMIASAAVMALVNLKQKTTRVINTLDKQLEQKDLDLRLRALIQEAIKELKKPEKKEKK